MEEGGRNWPRLLRFYRTISICVRFMLTLCVRIPLLHICNLAEANFKTTRRPLGLELAHVPMRARYTATCFVSLELKHAADPTSSLRCRHTRKNDTTRAIREEKRSTQRIERPSCLFWISCKGGRDRSDAFRRR